MTAAGLGLALLGVAVPVGVRVGVLRLPVSLVSSGRGSSWRPAAVAGWLLGLGGGVPGCGVRRVVLCGAQGSLGAAGAAGVGVSTLVWWRGGVCAGGWAWGDFPQASAFSSHLLEGLPQAPEDIRVVLVRGEVAGPDSLGVECIGQHSFPSGLWHPPPRRPEAAVLRRPLAGLFDQVFEGGLCPAHFRSSQSCVWVERCHHCPWAGPWAWAEEWALVGVMGSWGLVAVAGLGGYS